MIFLLFFVWHVAFASEPVHAVANCEAHALQNAEYIRIAETPFETFKDVIQRGSNRFKYEFSSSAHSGDLLSAYDVGILASKLTPSQRLELSKLLDETASSSSLGKEERRFLSLCFYDPETWKQWVKELGTKDSRAVDFNYLLPIFPQLPESLREELLKETGSLYSVARKNLNTKWHDYSPKRALDLLMRHLLAPEQIFSQSVRSGMSPIEAYAKYFSRVKQTLRNPKFGDYSVKDVVGISKAFQKVLKENLEKLGLKDPVVVIGGSFPNAKAVMNQSDLDFRVSDLNRIGRLESQFEGAIRKVLGDRFPGNPLKLKVESRGAFNEEKLGEVNPVVIRITTDKIELLVYPPQRSLPQYEFHNSRKPAVPIVYSLS